MDMDKTNPSMPKFTRDIDNLKIVYTITETELGITNMVIEKVTEVLLTTLSIEGDANTEAYIPAYNCNPTSKKYVDDEINKVRTLKYSIDIGDGESTEFTVKHDLGTDDIIITVRDNTTKEQVFVSNVIIDDDTIKIKLDTIIEENALNVTIISI